MSPHSPSLLCLILAGLGLGAPAPSQGEPFDIVAQIDGLPGFGVPLGTIPSFDGDSTKDFYAVQPYAANPGVANLQIYSSITYALLGNRDIVVDPNDPRSSLAGIKDINNDGVQDFVMQTSPGHVDCLDGNDLTTVLWSFDDSGATLNSIFLDVRAVLDLDGDNKWEVHLSAKDGDRYILHGKTGLIWQQWNLANYGETPGAAYVGDLNGDGVREMITVYQSAANSLWGFRLWDVATAGAPFEIGGSSGTIAYSEPPLPKTVGDINGDWVDDFVWAFTDSGGNGLAQIVDGQSLGAVLLNSISVSGNPTTLVGHVDWSGDGIYDFVVGNDGTALEVFDSATGDLLDTILSPDPLTTFGFGRGLSIFKTPTQNILLVGCPDTPSGTGGTVYLFSNGTIAGPPLFGGNQDGVGGSWVTQATINGGSANDHLGWSVSPLAADWDLDGQDDILVGVPGRNPSGGGSDRNTGEVVVVNLDLIPLANLTNPTLATNERMGTAVVGLRDLGNVNKVRIIAGAPYALTTINGGDSSGAVYMLDENGNNTLRLVSPNPEEGGMFGSVLANLSYLDNDFVEDFGVGAPGETVGNSPGSGRIYIYSGFDGTLLGTLEGPPNILGKAVMLGSSLSTTHDWNGDSNPDIAVGLPGLDSNNLFDNGSTWIFAYDIPTGTLLPGPQYDGLNSGDLSGTSVASHFDWDGDGLWDLAIGEPGFDVPSQIRGTTINGAGQVVIRGTNSGGATVGLSGDTPGGGMGGNITVTDLDGDHGGEVTSSSSFVGGTMRLSEDGKGMITTYSNVDNGIMLRRQGEEGGDQWGSTLGRVGDLDGDGLDELILGSPLTDTINGVDSGQLVRYLLDPFAISPTKFISASAGGTLTVEVDFPDWYALRKVQPLLSRSGTGPATVSAPTYDLLIPLTEDHLFNRAKRGVYSFGGSTMIRNLDANGATLYAINFNPGDLIGNEGKKVWMAFVAFDGATVFPRISSRAISFTIVP